jgi:hypothetical protein
MMLSDGNEVDDAVNAIGSWMVSQVLAGESDVVLAPVPHAL